MNVISELNDARCLTTFGEAYKLMICDKLSRGTLMVEIRTWIRWNTDHQFHPGKNGLMIEKKVLIDILPLIQEYLNDTSTQNPYSS